MPRAQGYNMKDAWKQEQLEQAASFPRSLLYVDTPNACSPLLVQYFVVFLLEVTPKSYAEDIIRIYIIAYLNKHFRYDVDN